MNIKETISDLYEMIDRLEKIVASEPSLLDRPCSDISLYVVSDSIEEAAVFCRTLGYTKKEYVHDFIKMGIKVGKFSELWTTVRRDIVCEKVITKKIVPAMPEREVEEVSWNCTKRPILAAAETLMLPGGGK